MPQSVKQYIQDVIKYTCDAHNIFIFNYNKRIDSNALELDNSGPWIKLLYRLEQGEVASSRHDARMLFLYNNDIQRAAGYLGHNAKSLTMDQIQQLSYHMNRFSSVLKNHFNEDWRDLEEISTFPMAPAIKKASDLHTAADDFKASEAFSALKNYYRNVLNSSSSRPQFFDKSLKIEKVHLISNLINDINKAESLQAIKTLFEDFYENKSKNSEYITLNTGRGIITRLFHLKTKSIQLIDKLYDQFQQLEQAEALAAAQSSSPMN